MVCNLGCALMMNTVREDVEIGVYFNGVDGVCESRRGGDMV